MASDVLHLDQNTFDETLATTDGVLMVDFWAEWCGPCRAVSPILEDLARTSGGKVTLAKVNVDEHPALAARFGVRSIPTILFVKDGKVRDQAIGALPKPAIQKKIDALLGLARRLSPSGAAGLRPLPAERRFRERGSGLRPPRVVTITTAHAGT